MGHPRAVLIWLREIWPGKARGRRWSAYPGQSGDPAASNTDRTAVDRSQAGCGAVKTAISASAPLPQIQRRAHPLFLFHQLRPGEGEVGRSAQKIRKECRGKMVLALVRPPQNLALFGGGEQRQGPGRRRQGRRSSSPGKKPGQSPAPASLKAPGPESRRSEFPAPTE